MRHKLPFESIISLGVDCRVRVQASRFFDSTRSIPPAQAGQGYEDLERAIVGINLFDWNMAWFHQVIRALENRFDSLFLEDRLQPLSAHSSVAVDGVYEFRYSHLFNYSRDIPFAEMITAQYRTVSRIIYHLRDKLLAHLDGPNPTLYVRCQAHEYEAIRFCEVIHRVYPAHRFHLLVVDMHDETTGLTAREADYTIYRMNSRVRKPPEAAWTGDDAEWDEMFTQVVALLSGSEREAGPQPNPIGTSVVPQG